MNLGDILSIAIPTTAAGFVGHAVGHHLSELKHKKLHAKNFKNYLDSVDVLEAAKRENERLRAKVAELTK